MKVAAVDLPGVGAWDVVAAAARGGGASFEQISREEFEAAPPECEVLVVVDSVVDAPRLDLLPDCRLIVGFGAGIDWIDLDAAETRGVAVANTPLANVEDVATHSLAMILALLRRLPAADALIRAGRWSFEELRPIERLDELDVGLLAFGNVPRRLAALLAPFGAPIRAFDPIVGAAEIEAHGVEPVELEELLRKSNVLSVHVPLTAETAGLLDREKIALLPAGALVVITGRGGTYDPEALADQLSSGALGGAAVDVFAEEPLALGSPLASAPNTILTPHLAGYSEGALRAFHQTAADAVEAFLAGREPRHLLTGSGKAGVGL